MRGGGPAGLVPAKSPLSGGVIPGQVPGTRPLQKIKKLKSPDSASMKSGIGSGECSVGLTTLLRSHDRAYRLGQNAHAT